MLKPKDKKPAKTAEESKEKLATPAVISSRPTVKREDH